MMLLIFVVLLGAFALGWSGRERFAVRVLACAFILAAGLFLWEIYSPTQGFAMPWIQVDRTTAAQQGGV